MIITYTFGFDERFAFRSLLRRGLGGSDKVAVLVPSNRPDEKSENALSSLDNFVKRYVNGEGVMRYEIEIDDFYVAVTIIAGLFRSWAERPIILNLSGGMRLLFVETLVAAVYCGIPIKVEMETEDGKTFTEFETPDLLPVRLDELDIEILKTLSNVKLTLKFLAEALQVAKPTAWRRVKKLHELGLVELERVTDRGRSGGKIVISRTPRANLHLKMSGLVT
jgi:CRISPR locus-related DNA-binding protein